MINGNDIYQVFAAIVPLYVAMILAYGSVTWWKIFTPAQCSGINRFVAVFAVPLLSFYFISSNNPYTMNYHFIAADCLQKVLILGALFLWQTFSKNGSLEWMITLFSLSTLPNTLVMGIPLLRAMYGDYAASLMVQIVVLQSVIWYTLMLFLFEYRGAKLLISEQFPETAASITSFRVESDVVSLNGREPLQADAEIGDDGKLHVTVRRLSSASSAAASAISNRYNSKNYKYSHNAAGFVTNNNPSCIITPRASNLTGVEIYSLQSSREPTPRASSFNQKDFYAMFAANKAATSSPKHGYTSSFGGGGGGGGGGGDVFSSQSSKAATPTRTSNFEDEMLKIGRKTRGIGRTMSGELFNTTTPTTAANNSSSNAAAAASNNYPRPPPNPMFSVAGKSPSFPPPRKEGSGGGGGGGAMVPNNELHMFVWSSSASPVSADGSTQLRYDAAAAGALNSRSDASTMEFGVIDSPSQDHKEIEIDSVVGRPGSGSTPPPTVTNSLKKKKKKKQQEDKEEVDYYMDGDEDKDGVGGGQKQHSMPPASVMTRLILIMVWRKLIRNPNTYSSLFGLVWSLISFR